MYRLEGIVDRIQYNGSECDKALEDYREAIKEGAERSVLFLCHQITTKQTQMKVHKVINEPNFIEELAAIFRLIDKNIESEQRKKEKGIANHLLAIVLYNLNQSAVLWRKFVAIIGNPSNREVVADLNKILKHQSVMNCMSEVIEQYFNCLCELGDEFFIDVAAINDDKKLSLFKTITVPEMILIIHHLLSLPESSQFIADKLFNTLELSPSFTSYLNLSLRNLSL